MTSQRQRRQDHYDHIMPFMEEVAYEYYGGDLDQGFRHWAFATIFGVGHDIGDNDIVDYTAIDGSDDFEIDGYFIPETDDDSVVHLFQSKHRQPRTTMGVAELSKFLDAPNRILNVNQVAASRNEETKALHDRLVEKLLARSDTPCSINLVWATSGTLSQQARRHSEENSSRTVQVNLGGNPVEMMVSLQCWDLADLRKHHEDQQSSDDETVKCDVKIQLEQGTYHQTGADAEYRTISMTVPVKQIIDVFALHSYKIFQRNPRGPLGNKVNTNIKNTLLNEIDRKRFHLLNNGITAICHSWKLDDEHLLSVEDFQIINGCQTTVTLWDARAAIQNDANTLINVKLTECPPHFSDTIARASNRQTALRAEDFVSNEPVQNRLKQEFSRLSPPWFYQIKRGEWSRMMRPADREAYRDPVGGFRQINSKDVAQAVVAFAGYPGEAKDKVRDFLNKSSVSSLAKESEFHYDEIYTDNAVASQFLLPALVQRTVKQKVNLDKERDAWLDYGRFHVVWLIGAILREHYGLTAGHLFPANRAATLSAHLNDWFDVIYNVSVVAIRNALQETENKGEFTGYREFFRTAAHYRTIESNLRNALRLSSNFGNPMANLPS